MLVALKRSDSHTKSSPIYVVRGVGATITLSSRRYIFCVRGKDNFIFPCLGPCGVD